MGVLLAGGQLDFIEVNEQLTIMTTVETQGPLLYNYDLGDGRNVTTDRTNYTFKYERWGRYVIVVTVFNDIGKVNITNHTEVHRPLDPMEGTT